MIAIVSMVTSLAVLATALIGLRLALAAQRKARQVEREAREKAAQIQASLEGVHGLVNSQLDRVLDRVEQLTELLRASGIRVPPPESPPAPE